MSQRQQKASWEKSNGIERTGEIVQIGIRVDAAIVARLDEIAREISVGWLEAVRSDALRLIIHEGLKNVDIEAVRAEIMSKTSWRADER